MYGPMKHPKPLNKLNIPIALLKCFTPTNSIKNIVVNELKPAIPIAKNIQQQIDNQMLYCAEL
jgi:hypothetical protein